jgi:hypothetical protein
MSRQLSLLRTRQVSATAPQVWNRSIRLSCRWLGLDARELPEGESGADFSSAGQRIVSRNAVRCVVAVALLFMLLMDASPVSGATPGRAAAGGILGTRNTPSTNAPEQPMANDVLVILAFLGFALAALLIIFAVFLLGACEEHAIRKESRQRDQDEARRREAAEARRQAWEERRFAEEQAEMRAAESRPRRAYRAYDALALPTVARTVVQGAYPYTNSSQGVAAAAPTAPPPPPVYVYPVQHHPVAPTTVTRSAAPLTTPQDEVTRLASEEMRRLRDELAAITAAGDAWLPS